MQIRVSWMIATLLCAVPAAPASADYASVNGLKMYYEIQGAGRPLVLLHGGLCTIEVCLEKIRQPFVKTRRTIAIEQQAHGRTADIDRPLSIEQMAADTAALLRQLKIRNADFFGYSLGGSTALGIALKHPDLVRKVAVFGSAHNNAGLVPGLVDNIKKLKAHEVPKQFYDGYVKVAPDPKQWAALVAKIANMLPDAKGFSPEDVRSIKAPTLIMVGDSDIVRPEHAVEMFRLHQHAQLAVLPGASHFAPMERSEWIVSMTRTFLAAPMPKAKE
jgi:pimeloyl-ACP methyl ester carboxylesterase